MDKVQHAIDTAIAGEAKTKDAASPAIPPGREFSDTSLVSMFYRGLIDPVRQCLFVKPVLYKTMEGTYHPVKMQPWAYNNFQGLQFIGENAIGENNFRASWKLLKDELNIGVGGAFRSPQVGDEIIEADGTVNVVEPFMGQPHFSYSSINAAKTSIIIHSRVRKPLG
jgi:hypothetical protein